MKFLLISIETYIHIRHIDNALYKRLYTSLGVTKLSVNYINKYVNKLLVTSKYLLTEFHALSLYSKPPQRNFLRISIINHTIKDIQTGHMIHIDYKQMMR